jgi:hypothetical protein
VNRSPRDARRLYPDPTGNQAAYGPLRVYWLEVNGATAARSDYEAWPNKPQVLAALTMIDRLLAGSILIPKNKMESLVQDGIKMYEIKAPPRGRQIYRLLAYRESEWDLFVAFAKEKKTQELPDSWKETAANRIRAALREGRPL